MPRFACSATSLLGACLLLLGHVAHLQAAEEGLTEEYVSPMLGDGNLLSAAT